MSIEVGSKVSGKVTGITNFGAFVDLGEGKTGLVHISEVSNEYVKDIHDVLKVGDEVTVKVMSNQDGKIGLSIRRAQEPVRKNFDNDNHHNDNHRNNHGHNNHRPKKDFDTLLANFLKESEAHLTELKHNTEGKRGGRGGRRS